jgi:hypothetical protein
LLDKAAIERVAELGRRHIDQHRDLIKALALAA